MIKMGLMKRNSHTLKILKIHNEALANYGADINTIGKEKSIQMAIDIVNGNETDVDLIADIGNATFAPVRCCLVAWSCRHAECMAAFCSIDFMVRKRIA